MAARQSKAPAAFLSYAHLDDEASGGQITRLRKQLALDVGAALGRPFDIFQDHEGIAWGQHWASRLDEALEEVLFLIPILTPAYFNSRPCRAELEKFLELERRTGRNDLVLPIYFVQARPFDERSDPLAEILSRRQYRDWRDYRHRSIRSPKILREIAQLAREMEVAIHRPVTTVGGRPASSAQAEMRGELRRTSDTDRPIDSKPAGGDHRAKQAPVDPPESGEPERVTLAPKPVRRPSEAFRDVEAPWCPELVVIPAGRFWMGSPEGEEGRYGNEGPQHEVVIGAPFALGRYPVTFAEYDAFCEDAGRKKPGDAGWGRGRRPAIGVSWEDAQAYVAWLRERTGQPYRLPSEAEWEYACRAGTTTPFWTGATIDTDQANYDGNSTYGPGRKGEYRRQTTPVDTFAANPFGLHDMHGNVWEWVEDRWHGSYEGAPTDGSAWVEGTESARVVRGGSWDYDPRFLRSACRLGVEPEFRFSILGFRVARMLTP